MILDNSVLLIDFKVLIFGDRRKAIDFPFSVKLHGDFQLKINRKG